MKTLIWLLLLLALAAGAVTIAGMAGEVRLALGTLPVLAMLAVLGFATMNYLVRFIRWHAYLRLLGERLPWAPDLSAYLAGFAFTATPAKAGEAGRAVLLKPYGVTHTRTIATCAVERTCDLAVVLLLAGIAVAVNVEFTGLVLASALLLLAPLTALTVTGIRERLASMLRRWLSRFGTRAESVVDRSFNDFLALVRPRPLAFGLVLGITGWLSEGFGFCYLLDALGASLPWHFAVGIYMLALLAGALSFLPGGLIATEISLLALLIAQDVPRDVALTATIGIRVGTLGYSLLLGGLALAVATYRNRRPRALLF